MRTLPEDSLDIQSAGDFAAGAALGKTSFHVRKVTITRAHSNLVKLPLGTKRYKAKGFALSSILCGKPFGV